MAHHPLTSKSRILTCGEKPMGRAGVSGRASRGLALPLLGCRIKKKLPRPCSNIYASPRTFARTSERIIMASCSRFTDPLPELPSSPHQPSEFTFPKRSFGKTAIVWRSFQPLWFKLWPFTLRRGKRRRLLSHLRHQIQAGENEGLQC